MNTDIALANVFKARGASHAEILLFFQESPASAPPAPARPSSRKRGHGQDSMKAQCLWVLTTEGEAMTSGQVNKILKSKFGRVTTDKTVNTTLLELVKEKSVRKDVPGIFYVKP